MDNVPEEATNITEFFRLTASDLSISQDTFYDVDDPEDIDFVFGEITEDILYKEGYFKYAGQIETEFDSEAKYYYNDSYFYNLATEYNPFLATMSLNLELASWSSYNKDNWYNPNYKQEDNQFWQDKLCNIKTLLLGSAEKETGYEGLGFSDFKANYFWGKAPTKDSIGVCAARKQITDKKGEQCTLVAVAVRGGGYGAEWSSNFTIGLEDEHDGFATARDNTLDFIDDYISNLCKEESTKIKLRITGYSRVGATANLVAGALNSYHHLPNNIITNNDNVYCYTFEAPQGSTKSIVDDKNYNHENIFNIRNLNDLVPLIAPSAWDFAKYNYQDDIMFPSKYLSKNFTTQNIICLNS